MSVAPVPAFYRLVCPHCQRVLKFPADGGPRMGRCPNCRMNVDLPRVAGAKGSATAAALRAQLQERDEPTVDDAARDRLALLLSLGTCRDYQDAHEFQNGRLLSARQWRRILNSADQREQARLRLAQRLSSGGETGGEEEPLALALASGASLSADAWSVLARYLYYQRHGPCAACQRNPTGLECVYLTFDACAAAFEISTSRCLHWRTLIQQHLGL